MRKTILLIRSSIALSTILIATAPAEAEGVIVTGTTAPSVTVSTTDFDLGSPASVNRLKDRVKSAAAELCLTNAVEPVDVRMARVKCFRTAVSSGHRQVDRMVATNAAQPMRTATAVRLDSTVGRQP